LCGDIGFTYISLNPLGEISLVQLLIEGIVRRLGGVPSSGSMDIMRCRTSTSYCTTAGTIPELRPSCAASYVQRAGAIWRGWSISELMGETANPAPLSGRHYGTSEPLSSSRNCCRKSFHFVWLGLAVGFPLVYPWPGVAGVNGLAYRGRADADRVIKSRFLEAE
jgi:hypothetical protein